MTIVTRSALIVAALTILSTAAHAGGACYRKVATAPVYGNFAKQVLIRPAQTSIHKIDAQYGTVHKTVMVRPAQRNAHHIPAVTRTIAQRVMVQGPAKVWSVTRDRHGQEVGCWVHKPAVYSTQYRKTVVRPAGVSYSVIPAEYRTVSKQVVVRPARLVERTVPAVYATCHYRTMVSPGTVSWQRVNPICD